MKRGPLARERERQREHASYYEMGMPQLRYERGTRTIGASRRRRCAGDRRDNGGWEEKFLDTKGCIQHDTRSKVTRWMHI